MDKLKIGEYHDSDGDGKFFIPRCQFLLHQVKLIEEKLIKWYKKNHYSQGDHYIVYIDSEGRWVIQYSNDYPLQHGFGTDVILNAHDFMEAMKTE